jgi:IS30 family transposase
VERLSEREKEEIARLLAMGLPSRLIGAQIGRHHRTVWGYLARLRRPAVPEPRRSRLRLSLSEREEISRGLAGGESLRAIAWRLGRASSTISREVDANGGRTRYRACIADKAAVRRTRRPKRSKLASCPRLRAVVEAKLELRSPQQISGWLVAEFPDDPEMRVSHETIYVSLFVQSRGALRKELTRSLRSRHTTRRPRGHSVMNGQGQLRATLNIRERPADANDRAVPGHWEGDLLFGKRMRAMATLVERTTRFVMLIALPNGHAADVVADALAAKIIELPDQLRRSLTWDQGKEMADHARFTITTGVQVYFCDPRSPGNAAAMRTPTACSANTSPSVPRSRTTPKPTSTPSQQNSTAGLDKHSDGDHHHKHSTKRCDDPLNPQQIWIEASALSLGSSLT